MNSPLFDRVYYNLRAIDPVADVLPELHRLSGGITFALFLAYYITKTIVSALVLRVNLSVQTIGLTIATFGILTLITYALPQRSWMKM